jgi:hypothetical protein
VVNQEQNMGMNDGETTQPMTRKEKRDAFVAKYCPEPIPSREQLLARNPDVMDLDAYRQSLKVKVRNR